MQPLIERGCGLDVHQASVVACLLMVSRNGKLRKQMQTYGTTTRELLSLRQWLLAEGCTHRVARHNSERSKYATSGLHEYSTPNGNQPSSKASLTEFLLAWGLKPTLR